MGDRVGGLLAVAAVVGIGGAIAFAGRAAWLALERAFGRGAAARVVPEPPEAPVARGAEHPAADEHVADEGDELTAQALHVQRQVELEHARADELAWRHIQLRAAFRGDAVMWIDAGMAARRARMLAERIERAAR